MEASRNDAPAFDLRSWTVKQPQSRPPDGASERDKRSERGADAADIRAAVERYEGPLTLYAARLVGDVDRARDIVQDTFLKLWTADRAAINGHLGQWLYRVCRNRALDVCRKEVRMTTLQDTQIEARIAAPPTSVSGSESGIGGDGKSSDMPAGATSSNVLAMLGTLPERQQEVIRLKFQGGLSYQEIANVMEITANHVGVLIHTALKTIREKLNAPELKSPGAGGLRSTR